MKLSSRPITEKKMHALAEDVAEEFVFLFADALVLESKTLASVEGADEVQSSHVRKAREIVLSLSQRKSRTREALLSLGTLLFGIGVQGFVSEYWLTPPRPALFALYSIVGLGGSILWFSGLLKKTP